MYDLFLLVFIVEPKGKELQERLISGIKTIFLWLSNI